MAVTFGFYNSRNGDRIYNAQQMSSIFSGIIRDGVFEHFPAENQHLHVDWLDGHVGENVVIGPGRAWLNNTWTDNDSNLVMQLAAPNPNPNIERIDAIVLEINKTNNSDFTANMSEAVPGRSNKFIVLKGTEASPSDVVKPALRNGNGIYQHYIALVRVSANSEHHYITNMVGANDGTPYIIGAVQSVSTADVLQAWTQAFNAEISRLSTLAEGHIDEVCEEYFEDPTSMVYQKIDEIGDNLNDSLSVVQDTTDRLVKRRHVWIIDRPVSSIAGYTATYSKDVLSRPPVNDPPHNIYPDFTSIPSGDEQTSPSTPSTTAVHPETSPKVGDAIIGSNGYYAVITHWQLSGNAYSMIIRSTGKAILEHEPEDLVLTFTGGFDKDGYNISQENPAACDVSFSDIRDAYTEGRKLTPKMYFWEQVHGDGGNYDVEWHFDGTIEKQVTSGVLSAVTARFINSDTQNSRTFVHEYTITPYGVTCKCVIISA